MRNIDSYQNSCGSVKFLLYFITKLLLNIIFSSFHLIKIIYYYSLPQNIPWEILWRSKHMNYLNSCLQTY